MELTERKKKILRAIVDEYIRTAEPVGSKTIAQMPGMDFSSGHQPQPSAYDPVVMPTDGRIHLAPQFVGVSGPVGGITKKSVEDALCRDASV